MCVEGVLFPCHFKRGDYKKKSLLGPTPSGARRLTGLFLYSRFLLSFHISLLASPSLGQNLWYQWLKKKADSLAHGFCGSSPSWSSLLNLGLGWSMWQSLEIHSGQEARRKIPGSGVAFNNIASGLLHPEMPHPVKLPTPPRTQLRLGALIMFLLPSLRTWHVWNY